MMIRTHQVKKLNQSSVMDGTIKFSISWLRLGLLYVFIFNQFIYLFNFFKVFCVLIVFSSVHQIKCYRYRYFQSNNK